MVQKFKLENKLICYAGDNAPVNFGNVHRTGTGNVFKRMKVEFNTNLIGSGCIAHTTHNAMKHGCDQLEIDVQHIAVKIYTHFHRYTVRLSTLKEYCDSVGEVYTKLKGYTTTRFLALKECLNSIIANFDGLREYFDSFDAPRAISDFFQNPLAKLTFIFVRDQADNFQQTILKIEGNDITAVDAADKINLLINNVKSRLRNKFMSADMKNEMAKQTAAHKKQFDSTVKTFHDSTLNYLNNWCLWLKDVEVFNWIRLRAKPSWNEIERSIEWMVERQYFDAKNTDKVFGQFAVLEQYFDDKSFEPKKSTQERWVLLFKHFNERLLDYDEIATIAEFALAIPATNTVSERVFSHINDIWTPDKGQLKLENVRARVMTKFNWNMSCMEFYDKIKDDTPFLKKVQGKAKYNTETVESTNA